MSKSCLKVLMFMLIAGSCRDNADEKQVEPPEVQDSVVTEQVDTVLSSNAVRYFEDNGFSSFAKSRNPKFNWNSFHLVNVWKEDTLLTTPFDANEKYFKSYGQFIKYSSDSTMFIDLDSYNIAITRMPDGSYIGEELGPDT